MEHLFQYQDKISCCSEINSSDQLGERWEDISIKMKRTLFINYKTSFPQRLLSQEIQKENHKNNHKKQNLQTNNYKNGENRHVRLKILRTQDNNIGSKIMDVQRKQDNISTKKTQIPEQQKQNNPHHQNRFKIGYPSSIQAKKSFSFLENQQKTETKEGFLRLNKINQRKILKLKITTPEKGDNSIRLHKKIKTQKDVQKKLITPTKINIFIKRFKSEPRLNEAKNRSAKKLAGNQQNSKFPAITCIKNKLQEDQREVVHTTKWILVHRSLTKLQKDNAQAKMKRELSGQKYSKIQILKQLLLASRKNKLFPHGNSNKLKLK